MMRCYLPTTQWDEAAPTLDADESAHLITVLRATDGDEIQILDGCGQTGTAILQHAHKKHTILRITSHEQHPTTLPRRILIQALVREQRMDLILQKAVELGAHEIWPIQTENCVVKLSPSEYAKKTSRWQAIALNACKQSGNPFLLKIRTPMTLIEAIQAAPHPSCYGALVPNAISFSAYLQKVHTPTPNATAVFIGPEGDFSPAEYEQLAASSHQPVSFGSLILRSETAALFALSALHLTF